MAPRQKCHPKDVAKSTPPSSVTAGTTRTPYFDRDLTTGSIFKNLLHLAWPQALEGIFNTADQISSVIFAGFLTHSSAAIAGVGVAFSYLVLGISARSGLDTAMRAVIARAIGARNM